MDGVLNFIMTAVSNPVVGLILLGVVLGLIFASRK